MFPFFFEIFLRVFSSDFGMLCCWGGEKLVDVILDWKVNFSTYFLLSLIVHPRITGHSSHYGWELVQLGQNFAILAGKYGRLEQNGFTKDLKTIGLYTFNDIQLLFLINEEQLEHRGLLSSWSLSFPCQYRRRVGSRRSFLSRSDSHSKVQNQLWCLTDDNHHQFFINLYF